MKANGAPEKIYLQPSAIEQLPHQNIVYTKPLADNSIEYTRTDAFIEKATKYLYEYNQNMVKMYGAKAVLSCSEFTINVEDFKKAMTS